MTNRRQHSFCFTALLFTFLPLPVAAASPNGQVVVEEAWIVPDSARPESANAYVVINNGSATQVTLERVIAAGVESSVLLAPSGLEMIQGATIPMHAELYMLPGGVRIALAGIEEQLVPGQMVSLDLKFRQISLTVSAEVLPQNGDYPDHHDFQH